jgi:hypothetical protein
MIGIPSQLPDVNEVCELVDEIRPLFAGREPSVIGAALADLLATLLASHVYFDDTKQISRVETDELREALLTEHIKAVRTLVPVNEAEIHEGNSPCIDG